MYIYESHMGSLYVSGYELDYEEIYCETCGDCDWLIGHATTKAEAWELLKNDTSTFDPSMCDGCPHNGYDDYCNEECENFLHNGGWCLDYVRKFIDDNWNE